MGNLASTLPLETVSKRVQYLVENYPDRELFVFYQGENRNSYTSQKLFQLAGRFANRLRHQYGFKRSDIIANTLPNSPERLITDLGITLAGCTCMNGQILLADGADFFQSARNSKCSGVILRPEEDAPAWRLLKPYVTGSTSSSIIGLSCNQATYLTSAIPVTRRVDGLHKPLLEDLRNSNDEVYVDSTIGPDDLVYIFTTSGSTGYSKLVSRTNTEIIDIANSMRSSVDPEVQGDCALHSDRLLGWAGGYPFNAFCNGQRRVMLDFFDSHGKKSGETTWKVICKEKCAITFIFPLEVESILSYVTSIGGADYKLKLLASGAQPLKKSQISNMCTLAEKVLVGYASTEVVPLATATVTSADTDDFFCGKPAAGTQFRVTDEQGHDCKPRQTGNVLAKSPNMFRGYFNLLQDPDPNTAKCFTKDGWFDTEDIGYLDEEGNVYVMGRNKDTIIYGSSVLYPGWLEAKIMQHPEVAEARILPVSDPVLYQNICACVKPVSGSDLNEEKLKAYCETIFISDLDSALTPMPKYFMVLEHFPETATGKPDKQILTRMAEERFGTASK